LATIDQEFLPLSFALLGPDDVSFPRYIAAVFNSKADAPALLAFENAGIISRANPAETFA
jgi:hypothetical protein